MTLQRQVEPPRAPRKSAMSVNGGIQVYKSSLITVLVRVTISHLFPGIFGNPLTGSMRLRLYGSFIALGVSKNLIEGAWSVTETS